MKKMEDYIYDILLEEFQDKELAKKMYESSELLQYFNLKSGAIRGDVKSRRAFANWYSIYAILHFYTENGFVNNLEAYLKFEGFQYTTLFNFMKNLYGGSKLQNHALNSRVNGEFSNKIATDSDKQLILISNNRYLLHPSYLYVKNIDLTPLFIKVIHKYISLLQEKDNTLSVILQDLKAIDDIVQQKQSISKLLTDDSEARIFEIVSYAVLANHYRKTKVFIGYTTDELEEHYLQLYKTGRTNANDGGIDFVMRPIGRFFQVTEVNNYNKFFLDIDKVLRFPVTFVVKTSQEAKEVYNGLVAYAEKKSGGHELIKAKYIEAIEEVITINELKLWLSELTKDDIDSILVDIDTYYRLELNLNDE